MKKTTKSLYWPRRVENAHEFTGSLDRTNTDQETIGLPKSKKHEKKKKIIEILQKVNINFS